MAGLKEFFSQKRRKRALRALRALVRLDRKKVVGQSPDNRVLLYENGQEYFTALFAALAEAKDTIYIEFYTVKADTVGSRFAQALKDAAARGVEVVLIYDYVGSYETPAIYFQELQQVGVHCHCFNIPAFHKLHLLDRRNHRKIVVIDSKTAFLGGINVGDEYAGLLDGVEGWRDVGIRIDGSAAAELHSLVCATWEYEEGSTLRPACFVKNAEQRDGDAEIMIVNGTPLRARSTILGVFRLAIAGARESIKIMTPYFVPGPRIVRSLLRAHKGGVRVQLIVPEISDVPFIKLVSRAYLAPMVKAGIDIYERQGTFLHAKIMLIDDIWLTLGSANLDQRSFHRNFEVNVVIASIDFGRQIARMFGDDISKSRRLLPEEFEHTGLLEHFLRGLLAPLTHFL